MSLELLEALEELEKERGLSKEILLEAIEAAIVSAYKRNYNSAQNVRVEINENTGNVHVYSRKLVVEEIEDPRLEISLEEAKNLDPRYDEDDIVEQEITPRDFGRIAAQTAKQVVVQRIREAERGIVYDEYSKRVDEVITGIVQRKEGRSIIVDIGKVEALLPPSEQMMGEHYQFGMRLKFYVVEVKKAPKGPQIVVSRTHPALVKRLFELEAPEIQEGIVQIRGLAREAGKRTKIAVASTKENVDPVGACVGARGVRVQAVVSELRGEKIDIIPFDEDPATLIANALSPAKVNKVIPHPLDRGGDEQDMLVIVPDDQLSLAIGKEGQNARLASKLSGCKIDIKSESQSDEFFRKLLVEPADQGEE
jgi:N utilization substance protein A